MKQKNKNVITGTGKMQTQLNGTIKIIVPPETKRMVFKKNRRKE